VVLYGCETLSLALREENRPRAFENSVLKRILGPKRDKIIGGLRKLYIVELYSLYSSPDITRMIKAKRTGWAGHVACMRTGLLTGVRWEGQKEGDN
jgi:hypothetical protein